MKLSIVNGVAAVLAVASAYSIPSPKEMQQLLFKEVASSTDKVSSSLQSLLDGPMSPDVRGVWADMLQEVGVEEVDKLLRKYNSQKSVSAAYMNNHYNAFTTMKEPGFEEMTSKQLPGYTLRVKETYPEKLQLDSSKYYTGYLDVEALGKHFFYWFFESRNDPKNDPVVLWLNGGPGCSSSIGLLFELGSSRINSTLQVVENPYSWNSNASVIFLDQPVGVGYSYTTQEQIRNTAAAAKDVYSFLELFFQKFPEFAQNNFHMAGESYAGHYIPAFGAEIINHADRSFNLTSILIGNGLTNPLIQSKYYKPMACGEGGHPAVLSPETCDQMDRDWPKFESMEKLCYKYPSAATCVPADYFCEKRLFGAYEESGLNPYDIRYPCNDPSGKCYEDMEYIDDFLDLPYVKDAVGASNIDIYTSCDSTVFSNFIKTGDEMKPFHTQVAELLNNDIPVLLYAGDKDYICNWLGNHAWANELEYKDMKGFQAASLVPWKTKDGEVAGEIQNHGIFSFVRVYNAGHMVPYNQPENALDMLNRWLSGDYALKK